MRISSILPATARPLKPKDPPSDEVVPLTQDLVRIDSSPTNLVPGMNQVVDRMVAYASQAGLQVERFETVDGKPMLIVTLPGKNPAAGSVGFVHHSDVVPPEGEWKLGPPYSGNLTRDEKGRQVLVGRGSLDTKGPAAQILVAMKRLKEQGVQLDRNMKLFMFPDEETGGKDGAWLLSRTRPELFRDVRYWLVEASGILSPEYLKGLGADRDVPYLAVAQKYTLPVQAELKNPAPAPEAIQKTRDAMERLDDYLNDGQWTHLGDHAESKESYRRLGNFVGGFKGWMVRHFWNWRFMQERMGPSLAAANRSDLSKTDFYLSNNPGGKTEAPNVKPSSATFVLELALAGADREKALQRMRDAAGEDLQVVPLEPLDNGKPTLPIRLTLPQENYHGGNHGSTADREHDAIDVTERALDRIEDSLRRQGWADKLRPVDVYTSKSPAPPTRAAEPVKATLTLDLRVAVDDDRREVLNEVQQALGPDFQLKPLIGPEEFDSSVRRLSHRSPLFLAAEDSIRQVYGQDTPILFGNTTASNDVRFLMDANPQSEALTFVPVLYTEHGAHGPDECVTVDSLKSGVDWTVELMKRVGTA
ncbi:MAG: M20/M25/M40 family metallo-hydrolase [Candidatus Eremiobacterota bacterium]